jgi:hypothetical protein
VIFIGTGVVFFVILCLVVSWRLDHERSGAVEQQPGGPRRLSGRTARRLLWLQIRRFTEGKRRR